MTVYQRVIRALPAIAATTLLLQSSVPQAAPFKPGNVVVYRVGDGPSALTSGATAVFLDEINTTGAVGSVAQSIAMPTAASGINKRLTASGTSATDGLLNRTVDARYLLATGYEAAVGTAGITGTTSAANPRVVARIFADGSVDSSTALNDAASATNFRSAASIDGTAFWVTGGAGTAVRYATYGSTTSTQLFTTPSNFRFLSIVGGQLYVSSGAGSFRLATVGTGTPTTAGQALTNLPGVSTTALYDQFFFADLSGGVAGVDTLYVADETNTVGIIKYSLVGGTWVSNGSVPGTSFAGLTGVVNGGAVELYAVRNGTDLVKITDSSGYNGSLTGTIATTIRLAATNTAFRGVSMAPQANVTVSVTAGANGMITPGTLQTALLGSTLTFTVQPDNGFSAVMGGTCGGSLSGTTYTTNTLLADCSVSASFVAIPTYTVTPSIVSGSGTITPSAAVSVLYGATTQFTVEPAQGFTASVVGCGGSLAGITYTTGAITSNCDVQATFTQITYQVTPSAGPNGSIDPSVAQTVNAFSTTSFSVQPQGGYMATVGGSCGGTLTGTTYTTNPVTTHCSVDATFAPLPVVSTVLVGNGSLTPTGPVTVNPNSTLTFTPAPASGYSVVMSGCGGKMSGATFTTGPITADCTVTATFATKNILFVGNSYTFARVDPAMTFNAANVNDLTAAFNAQYPNGTNSWPWNGSTCTGAALSDGCFEQHPWGGVPGIFKALTVQAGLDFNVSFSTRNAATLRGHFLNTSNAVWDLRSNIASQKWDIVMVQGQSDEPLPANKSKNGNPNSFKTYASQIARYVHVGNGQTTDLVTNEQTIYATEGFGTSSSTTARTIQPNFNANPAAKVYVMQNWSRPDMVEPHKCTVADYTSVDGAPLVDPTCAGNTNGSNGDNNVFYTAQPTTASNLNDITTDMNAALSSLLTGSNQLAGVIPTGNAFQKAVDASVVKNSAFYNASGTWDEGGGLMNLWWLDRTHGSKYGSYLSALTHFARLVGQTPIQFGPGDPVAAALGISGSDAVTLQQMAKAAVVPGAPTAASATAGNGSVTVSFTPAVNLGGLDVTGYTATCGSQSASNAASPIVVNGLANGVAVSCTVVATNSVGNSALSAVSNSVTPMAGSSIAVSANLNPTVVGQTVVFTATVTVSGSAATGSISFLDGTTPLCTGVSVTGNSAQCVTDALAAGPHAITAVYGGDVQYVGSTSAPYSQTVNATGTLQLSISKSGTGAGTVQSSPPGINCGVDCDETYASATPVSLGATADAGSVFTGWLGACTGRGACSLSMTASAAVAASFAPSSTALNLDVDQSGGYTPEHDGLLIVRYLFGIRGLQLVKSTSVEGGDPNLIVARLDEIRPLFDADGDGRVDAITDGILLMRYLLGIRGDALTASALAIGATRTTAGAVEAYVQGITPVLP